MADTVEQPMVEAPNRTRRVASIFAAGLSRVGLLGGHCRRRADAVPIATSWGTAAEADRG